MSTDSKLPVTSPRWKFIQAYADKTWGFRPVAVRDTLRDLASKYNFQCKSSPEQLTAIDAICHWLFEVEEEMEQKCPTVFDYRNSTKMDFYLKNSMHTEQFVLDGFPPLTGDQLLKSRQVDATFEEMGLMRPENILYEYFDHVHDGATFSSSLAENGPVYHFNP